jgi:hypothetical protein
MRRPFTVPALLLVGGLVWAGVHMLAHRLTEAGSAHAGHGHGTSQAAYLSTSLTLCLSLALVLAAASSLYPAWRGASARSLWLFGAVPLLGLFGGAALDSGGTLGGLGANVAALLPVALLVLAVQLAVALTAVRVARGLLDLVEGAARALAEPRVAATPTRTASFPRLGSVCAPSGRLAPSGGPRAPPAS